jgi:tRNA A37 threonylcarbamoyladenosine modification protein TsaB
MSGCGTDAQLIWSESYLGRDGSGRVLNSLLSAGLAKSQTGISDIKLAAISVGPGSFTGIKVGLSWLFGLAKGIGSDISILCTSAVEEGAILGAQDSGLDTAFVIGSTRTHGYFSTARSGSMGEARLLNLEDPLTSVDLFRLASNSRILLGNSWPEFEASKLSQTGTLVRLSGAESASLVLRALAACVTAQRGNRCTVDEIEPRYIRRSTAEEKLTAK